MIWLHWPWNKTSVFFFYGRQTVHDNVCTHWQEGAKPSHYHAHMQTSSWKPIMRCVWGYLQNSLIMLSTKRFHCNLSIYPSPHSSPKVKSRLPVGCMMQDWTLHLEIDTGICLRNSCMHSGEGMDYCGNFPFPVIKHQLIENGSGVQAFCPGHDELLGRAHVQCSTPHLAYRVAVTNLWHACMSTRR